MTALLFTGKNCKACPTMKQNLHKAGIKYDEYDTGERHNAKIAGMYMVKSLPTMVITDGGKPIRSIVGSLGVAELDKIRKMYKL